MPTKSVTVTIVTHDTTTLTVQLNYGQTVGYLLQCMGRATKLVNVHGKEVPIGVPLRGDVTLYEK
jgi:hypothetical protein